MSDFYHKPVHQRLAQRVFEGLISTAAVYLLSPQLLSFLTPLQAQLNAKAASNGQTPTTNGVSALANLLIQPPTTPAVTTVPSNTPPPTAPIITALPPTVTTIPATPGASVGT